MNIWLVVIGFFSGIISGMGIGGGAILIPAITMLFSVTQQQAQNINLIYFIPTAVIALVTHAREKNIEKKFLFRIIIFGVIGAVIGAMIAVKMESDLLRKCFGGFLLLMGALEFVKGQKVAKAKKQKA